MRPTAVSACETFASLLGKPYDVRTSVSDSCPLQLELIRPVLLNDIHPNRHAPWVCPKCSYENRGPQCVNQQCKWDKPSERVLCATTSVATDSVYLGLKNGKGFVLFHSKA